MFYHLRYAWRLWRKIPSWTLWDAWSYPFDKNVGDGDPIEDADEEISLMYE